VRGCLLVLFPQAPWADGKVCNVAAEDQTLLSCSPALLSSVTRDASVADFFPLCDHQALMFSLSLSCLPRVDVVPCARSRLRVCVCVDWVCRPFECSSGLDVLSRGKREDGTAVALAVRRLNSGYREKGGLPPRKTNKNWDKKKQRECSRQT
jgi:hypothetical protein